MFYVIEWWNAAAAEYQQEHFQSSRKAMERLVMLEDNVPLSFPTVQTLQFED
jgi:hypothetical protein